MTAQGGEGKIHLFKFHSNYNDPTEVAGGIVELSYYESILDNTIRCSATFVDTGYRGNEEGTSALEKDDINLTSGEKVELKIEDGYGTKLDLIGDKHLCINGDSGASSEDVNKFIFSVNMASKETIDNHNDENWVYGRYDGKIPESVESILKDVLKTPKDIKVDPGLNTYNFLGHAEKPFYLCTNLAKKCVPDLPNALGKLAGYLFYETYEGFQFRSIDALLSQEPKKKLIFNQIIGDLPPGYDAKIYEYSFSGTVNLNSSISSGSHTSIKIQEFNRSTNDYNHNSVSSGESYQEYNNAGKERAIIAKHTSIQERVTRHTNARMSDDGILPPGSALGQQIPNSQKPNFDMNNILRQSIMRYNQLFSHKMSIAIAGDFSLRAGDMIFCDFPEVSGKTNRVVSQKISGLYMIADVCHHLTKNGCFSRLNLVRDSIYRKPK